MRGVNFNIRQKRIEKGLNQYELALKTRMLNQSQISKIEKGKRKATADDLICIASALNLTIDELLK